MESLSVNNSRLNLISLTEFDLGFLYLKSVCWSYDIFLMFHLIVSSYNSINKQKCRNWDSEYGGYKNAINS